MLPDDIFVLETNFGEKVIEFRNQDITKLKDKVDILVVSVFKGGYKPTPGTLVNALLTGCSVSLKDESEKPFFSLKENMNTWFSRELNAEGFNRLLVVEMRSKYGDEPFDLLETFKNIFGSLAVADVRGIKIKTVAMTLLGTGQQGLDPKDVMPTLLEESKRALKTISNLEKIIYCERSEAKATIVYEALNEALKRTNIRFTPEQLQTIIEPIRNDLNKKIRKVSRAQKESEQVQRIISAWNEYVFKREFLPWHFGQFCRVFLENFLLYYKWRKEEKDTSRGINSVVSRENFSPWVQQYLHMLRVTGNTYSHERKDDKPSETEQKDIIIALNSLLRILDFWGENLKIKE